MKVSVLVPAYNCASTIRSTLDSVLQQTDPADEILVMNDGSTDETPLILESYKDRVTLYSQPNRGIANVRNELVARATGDLISFLDSDDLWHPKYLEVQRNLFQEHPEAVAFWAGHINFYGNGEYEWEGESSGTGGTVELIPALDFFTRYNRATGPFSCFSYCCVPRRVFGELGNEPFKEMGAEDSYCCSLLALVGPVVYCSAELVAYRLRKESLSNDHSWTFGRWVHVFELLEERFEETAGPELLSAFQMAFASKRRSYAKLLMGTGKPSEARAQLLQSVHNSANPISIAKSLSMLILTYLPRPLQPSWPTGHRKWKGSENV